jgi:ketosteroid isomerase-like protein
MPRMSTDDADRALTDYIDAINRNMPPRLDAGACARLFAEDGVMQNMTSALPGEPIQGRAAIEAFFASFDDHLVDWEHVERSRVVQGPRAMWEGVAQGTSKQTGQYFSMPIVFVIEFDETAQVRADRVYFDPAWGQAHGS